MVDEEGSNCRVKEKLSETSIFGFCLRFCCFLFCLLMVLF